MLGVRKPLLRWLSIGNEKYGDHKIGTPLKLSFTPRAVPRPAFVSKSISRARSSQDLLFTGQVVNSTFATDMKPALASLMCSPEPRAGFFGRSKSADENVSVSASRSSSAS